MTIKYLACYDTESNQSQKRAYPLAAAAVIPTVLAALKKNGHDVEVISFSSTESDQMVPGKCYCPEEGVSIRLFHSFGRRWLAGRMANRLFMKVQYCMYLLKNIREGDVVLAYHSAYYVRFLRWLRKHRDFRLVLQMLEIYADVTGDERLRKQEIALAEAADAFLFSSEILAEKINKTKKPAAIMLGNYLVEQPRNAAFDDGKIHVLYAGTLNPQKGGGYAAAEAAAFLPEHYHIHILGFGSEQEKAALQDTIRKSRKENGAAVTYEGCLSGEQYIRFVQKCSIGLSTQKPDAKFNDTSFPSKILSYLANGLRVVSIRIRAVEESPISDLVVYYNEQSPELIAKAITSVDMICPFDGRARINKLYQDFAGELDALLDGCV